MSAVRISLILLLCEIVSRPIPKMTLHLYCYVLKDFLISGRFSHGYDITPTIHGNIWESEFCIPCVHSMFSGMTIARGSVVRHEGATLAEILTNNFSQKIVVPWDVGRARDDIFSIYFFQSA